MCRAQDAHGNSCGHALNAPRRISSLSNGEKLHCVMNAQAIREHIILYRRRDGERASYPRLPDSSAIDVSVPA